MKNPLFKRLPRELAGEIGKYLVIFVFMAATIGLVSGFLVADNSMIETYDDSFDRFNIEDGKFELYNQLTPDEIEKLKESQKISIYENYYIEKNYTNYKEKITTVRIFKDRKEVNKTDLLKGDLPSGKDEIALDRLFARNNKIEIGDVIKVEDTNLKVTGFVALSDYSTLFNNNNDIMFDSVMFGVGIMSDEGYEQFGDGIIHYNYAWKYNEEVSKDNEIKKSDEILKALYEITVISENTISDFVPRSSNQAIQFAGEDMGGDRSIMIVLLYILIAIMSFVFAVTTNNTIAKEASVIGTLRASGYSRGEILSHYISLPVLVTLIAALVGNILGYTYFKDVCVDLYYNSYSLPSYKTLWNFEAFVLTTVIPLVIMLVINIFVLSSKLRLSPLRFLRHDLSKSKRNKGIKLPNFKFLRRFGLRVIIQNMSSYFTLFVGILFANLLLIFGEMLPPLLENYSKESVEHMICDYQYVLKTPEETDTEGVEKYSLTTLLMSTKLYGDEDVTIYGVENDSKYVDIDIEPGYVYISNTMADKYGLKKKDTFTLKNDYDDKKYEFKVGGIYNYPAAISLFMSHEDYVTTFGKESDYFNGYFSDIEIEDISEGNIVSVIKEEDLTKVTRQLKISMGGMMKMVNIFAMIMFALLIYLLTKLIIEKNSNSISMIKILGYNNREIAGIYLISTSIVVIISYIISLGIDTLFLKLIYKYIMAEMSGWMIFYLETSLYFEMFAYGIGVYLVVLLFQLQKIKRIPMTDALKNVE